MSFTAGAGTRFVVTSTASQSSGTVLTGPITAIAGTATTNTPAFDITQTWNAGAVTFTGLRFNVTDTASAAGSLLLDLQVGGVSRFSVTKGGLGRVSSNFRIGAFSGFDAYSDGLNFSINGTFPIYVGSSLNVQLAGSAILGWTSISNNPYGTATDTILARDAANTLAQRNATNAQTFRLYNTFTSATNFQRLGVTSSSTTLSALSGASVTATGLIPAGAVVVGVTTRVSTEITGATGYQVGTVADSDRWGDITGVAVGTTSDNTNWTAGTIECFTAASDVVITAKTSNFTAGAIVVVIHYLIGQAD